MTQSRDVEWVGRRLRVGAFIADAVYFGVWYVVGGLVWAFLPFSDIPYQLVFGLAWIAWHVRGAEKGQSPGKQLAGIRVVDDDGRAPSAVTMVVRDWFLRGFFGFWILDFCAYAQWGLAGAAVVVGVFVFAALWCLWDGERQCLWDKPFGTRVVYA